VKASYVATSKPIGASPHLMALSLQLAIFWGACFAYDRDRFFYVMSVIGAIALTLKWQDARSTVMPRWLTLALWVPGGGFVLLLAFVALRH
jgi:hypothetical protein